MKNSKVYILFSVLIVTGAIVVFTVGGTSVEKNQGINDAAHPPQPTNYFNLLKNKNWFTYDGPSGEIENINRYTVFDNTYHYLYRDGKLLYKYKYHFADNCVYKPNSVGQNTSGTYMVYEDDICNEITSITSSRLSLMNAESLRIILYKTSISD